jgi:hypothetical protein
MSKNKPTENKTETNRRASHCNNGTKRAAGAAVREAVRHIREAKAAKPARCTAASTQVPVGPRPGRIVAFNSGLFLPRTAANWPEPDNTKLRQATNAAFGKSAAELAAGACAPRYGDRFPSRHASDSAASVPLPRRPAPRKA